MDRSLQPWRPCTRRSFSHGRRKRTPNSWTLESRPCAGWGNCWMRPSRTRCSSSPAIIWRTFFLKSVPTFAILSCEDATAAFAGRTYNPPIHQALAEAVLEQLVARDFDMAYSQEADLGHSFAAIFEWVVENRAIPVVPIFINTYLPPLPSARRCAALGKAIAEIVASRPSV